MTEADSQALRISDGDDGRHDHVRRFPDIISQVKDSYTDLRPAERRVADVVL
ncbi:MAG: RpiR family transcriptional regulator, partial [Mesorhizobium sp.]